MLTKTQLIGLFAEHGFRPLKRLGENYLIDANIKDKIISEAAVTRDDVVLEIGPGFGALTLDLASRASRLYAVEKDKKAYSILKEIVNEKFPNLELLQDDILKIDIERFSSGERIKVIGNLPYYITTPIIEHLIEARKYIKFVLITVQKEVAARLTAESGDKDYGSISCFVQYYTKPEYIYTIKRTCFYPEPEVDSSLIRFDVLEKPSVDVKDEGLLFRIIRGAFNQKRKSIINSLSREAVLGIPKDKLSKILQGIGIDPQIRPESLSLSSFAKISNLISG